VHKKSCNKKFVIWGVVNLYIGTGSDWKNLPGTAQFLSTQTDTTMFALIYKIDDPNHLEIDEQIYFYLIRAIIPEERDKMDFLYKSISFVSP
jgi:hypothetical protein